jgi:hypothetical protein
MLYMEMLGVPVVSNYYALRLLPHLLGEIQPWRSRMARGFDILEAISDVH